MPGLVDRDRHRAAERVDLLDEMPLADAADRRVARHLAQRFDVVREHERPRPMRAAASAASLPAWPPPTTMTSYLVPNIMISLMFYLLLLRGGDRGRSVIIRQTRLGAKQPDGRDAVGLPATARDTPTGSPPGLRDINTPAPGASRHHVLFHVEQRQSGCIHPPPRCSTWNIRAPAGPDAHDRRQRSRLGWPVRPAIRKPGFYPAARRRSAPVLGYPPTWSTSAESFRRTHEMSGGKAAIASMAVARFGRSAHRQWDASNHPYRT